MEYDVVALALLTAVAWGASAPIMKLGMDRGGTPIQVAITVVSVSGVTYWAVLLLRGDRILGFPTWVYALFVATGLLATALARLLSFTGVERLGASVNSAGINTRPVLATILAVVLLGEAVTAQMSAGVVIVVIGLIALALSEGGDITGWDIPDLAFPLGAAFAFAIGNVARRFAFSTTDVTALTAVAINEAAGLTGLFLYLFVRHGSGARRALVAPAGTYRFFVTSGLLNALALFTLFEALNRGRVVVVDPLYSTMSLFAILFAFLLLREIERITRRLLIGAVLVVAGVMLITGPQVLTF